MTNPLHRMFYRIAAFIFPDKTCKAATNGNSDTGAVHPDVPAFIDRDGNLESELTFKTNAYYNAGTETKIVSDSKILETIIGGGSAGTVLTSVGAILRLGINGDRFLSPDC